MTDESMALPDGGGDVTAAELALGLLEGAERSVAMRRLLSDPEFARDVAAWRAHFATLIPAIPDVAPPAAGLARLQAAIGDAPMAANENRPVRFWQGIAGLSGLAAAMLVAALVLRPPAMPPAPAVIIQQSPALVATITPTKGAPIAAVFYPDRGELRVAGATLTDSKHSAELWVIAVDGVPHSLGVLPAGQTGSVSITGDNARRFVAGSKLVVTAEQIGGSPDGTPKGPAVAAGPLMSI